MQKLTWRRQALLLITLFCLASVAIADERIFPAQTKRGKLTVTERVEVMIDGKVKNTHPSTRIYNENDLIVQIATVFVKNAIVNYTENDLGDIEKIWLLTTQEASHPSLKKPQ
jgi:hypothetical protein